MRTTNDDWQGIANGDDYTIAQKTTARIGLDVPEDLERDMARSLGPEWQPLRRLWHVGLVDLGIDKGKAWASMTEQQAGLFREVRGH